jgi:succinoglycan biosynthesis protein ExoM
MTRPVRIAIGVCTAYRPGMMANCLAAIAAQSIPPGAELTVFAVDNEPEPNNRPVVEAAAAAAPFPILYVHEPRRGISNARNAVLDACANRFDWIAFTDDDCEPAQDWIACLVAAAGRHEADVIYGRRKWVPPQPAPFWLSPLVEEHADGAQLDYAATHNVLMSGALASPCFKERPAGLRFDERLAHGEDTDFFYRAVRLGAHIFFSEEAVVHETIPPHRATLRYHVMRVFYYAACKAAILRRYGKIDAAVMKFFVRLIWQVPIAICRLALAPLILPFSVPRFRRTVLKSVGRIAGAAGMASGMAGFIGNPYRNLGRNLGRSRSPVAPSRSLQG